MAQCEPRLIGLSQPGSWPTHTPFSTSAMTVQPTEQCVQMFLRRMAAPAGAGGGPASALRTLAERQRAEGGEPAGHEAGAAQEGAAVDAVRSIDLASAAASAPRRA